MGSSRLQQTANILEVPVTFFLRRTWANQAVWQNSLTRLRFRVLAAADGLALTKTIMQIKNAKLRRNIVNLVDEIGGSKK